MLVQLQLSLLSLLNPVHQPSCPIAVQFTSSRIPMPPEFLITSIASTEYTHPTWVIMHGYLSVHPGLSGPRPAAPISIPVSAQLLLCGTAAVHPLVTCIAATHPHALGHTLHAMRGRPGTRACVSGPTSNHVIIKIHRAHVATGPGRVLPVPLPNLTAHAKWSMHKHHALPCISEHAADDICQPNKHATLIPHASHMQVHHGPPKLLLNPRSTSPSAGCSSCSPGYIITDIHCSHAAGGNHMSNTAAFTVMLCLP